MQCVAPETYPGQDGPALLRFLDDCRRAAREKGDFIIASISLPVGHIDPLAVLQSIYEPQERHFYLEQPADGVALAGAEAIVAGWFNGPKRFQRMREFALSVFRRTIYIGDPRLPFGGPVLFAGITFDAGEEPTQATPQREDAGDSAAGGATPPEVFGRSTLFLPCWQVSACRGTYVATANSRIDPDTALEPLAERILRAHGRFSRFDYNASAPQEPSQGTNSSRNAAGTASGAADEDDARSVQEEEAVRFVEKADEGPAYEAAVREALKRIRLGRYEKIVLARERHLQADRPFDPLETVNRLRNRYPHCHSFSISNGRGQSFIGATPERLMRFANGELTTEAIAGSAPRGRTAREDAALAGALLGSAKDRREQQIVADSILEALQDLGLKLGPRHEPQLLRLPNIQHIRTPISARSPGGIHPLDIAARLHPTPAVGGYPPGQAIPDIPELESFSRKLYAGLVGWIDHRGHADFAVAIRSALISGREVALYAGAGIVEGSNPVKERMETDVKFLAMFHAMTESS